MACEPQAHDAVVLPLVARLDLSSLVFLSVYLAVDTTQGLPSTHPGRD